MSQQDSSSQSSLRQKIAMWKAGLADLGKRNPLIKFKQDSPKVLEILTVQPSALFQHLIKIKKSINVPLIHLESLKNDDGQNNSPLILLDLKARQSVGEQLSRLKKLRTEARRSLEERGVNSLFLSFGTLAWFDKDKPGDTLISPLILVPVELVKEPKRDVYKICMLEEDIVLNPTLALKLKQTFGIDLPDSEFLQEVTYSELITSIRTLLLDQETWDIKENVFLALFSYAKAAMVRDIIENEDRIFSHSILQAISGDLTQYQSTYKEPIPASSLDSQVKSDQVFQILDADSSQQVVIEAAKSGSSFIVEGPPGTGKSQTIVNMIAELIGSGKSVLLVAEKETALSVVYKRMAECGLSHLCLNLHHSGTTDKRKLIEDLSKTIEYIQVLGQEVIPENHDHFFNQLESNRQSLSSYLKSLHTKEKPLNQSPFELFGKILEFKREGISNLDIAFPNFNEWNLARLQEGKDLLNQLSRFENFFSGEQTTIWEKSSLNAYSYELELEIISKMKELQEAISSVQRISSQLQEDLKIQPLSNLESLHSLDPVLRHILKAPLQVPENWITTDSTTARSAFNILRGDIQEIEKKQLSQEASNLLDSLLLFMPFLKGEITTIWANSKLNSCSENLEIDLNEKLNEFKILVSLVQENSQRIQKLLGIEPLLNLEKIESFFPAFDHIMSAPSNLIDDWSKLDNLNSRNAFDKLNQDVDFLETNEYIIKQKYGSELFSSELSSLNSRVQRYSRFWLIRIFNPNYRRDVTYLRKLCVHKERVSYDELKYDVAQALQIQSRRNELHQNDYPARKIFGLLFDPDFSTKAQLEGIDRVLKWLDKLELYLIPPASIQSTLDSHSLRVELGDAIQTLISFSQDFTEKIDLLLLHFHEKEIFGQYSSSKRLPLNQLINFLNLLIADLPKFREWLIFRNISNKLENLGVQEFVSALREDRPNPLIKLRNKLSSESYMPRQIFGLLFNPKISMQSELNHIEEALDWLVELECEIIPASAVQKMLDIPSHRREIAELGKQFELSYASVRGGIGFLRSYFDEDSITNSYTPYDRISFVDLTEFLNQAQSDLPYFQDWLSYRSVCKRLESLGTKKFLNTLRNEKVNSKYWFPMLELIIYKTCLDAILARKPELKNFNVEVHKRQLQEFSKLDYNQLDIARERLRAIHIERWHDWERTSVSQAQMQRLKKEVTKKRLHLPIRKLLNDSQKGIPNLAQFLKPCWMMSPLSVSQYIDPDVLKFDVLIFDEASQLRTEDVVPSIIRSSQVIVIGDRKQLPPTSFFSSGESEKDDELDDENYESVLDECSNFMFGRTLRWHYRSQDERLISFSNLHFYSSELVTFPNPIQNPDLGVWFKHVPDGIYDRGKRRDNRREAEIVAQLALLHIQKTPDQSLGIIAFSEAQADAIQEQIEILGKQYPVLESFCRDNSPQFFLKALENVQGDERDVILLSIGYARDADGKLSLNFGPLNKKGGERRLNVAITRAKRKITLISSILAGDIDLTGTKSEGIRVLRDYLEYAASGGELLQGPSYVEKLNFDSPFEADVYHTLMNHSLLSKEYILRTQVGCSGYRIDLGVACKNLPGSFLLGIECDGASYHSSPTARDRDRLRQQVLEKLGWNIYRIWSTDWFRNKPEQVRLVVEKIEQLKLEHSRLD